MDFTNINDPAGVKALLEQLRSSQAWQESISTDGDGPPTIQNELAQPENGRPALTNDAAVTSGTTGAIATTSEGTNYTPPVASGSGSSVASLLSQLQSSTSWQSVPHAPSPVQQPPISHHVSQPSSDSHVRHMDRPAPLAALAPGLLRKDTRHYTFQQALPYLTQLADNQEFIASITRMKEEQDALERQLMEERKSIISKHEEKVKVARTKASMIGGGLSKHEADMMNQAFHKELQNFDSQRVLPAWDGLGTKQQTALEGLGVPTMFVTNSKADREKQQRVVQVLEGIVGADA